MSSTPNEAYIPFASPTSRLKFVRQSSALPLYMASTFGVTFMLPSRPISPFALSVIVRALWMRARASSCVFTSPVTDSIPSAMRAMRPDASVILARVRRRFSAVAGSAPTVSRLVMIRSTLAVLCARLALMAFIFAIVPLRFPRFSAAICSSVAVSPSRCAVMCSILTTSCTMEVWKPGSPTMLLMPVSMSSTWMIILFSSVNMESMPISSAP